MRICIQIISFVRRDSDVISDEIWQSPSITMPSTILSPDRLCHYANSDGCSFVLPKGTLNCQKDESRGRACLMPQKGQSQGLPLRSDAKEGSC